MTTTRNIPFLKMHGLGNDFVVIDRRRRDVPVDRSSARALADRRLGIGCDQVVAIDPGDGTEADARLTFWNADGSASDTCGNATRCVARYLMDEAGRDRVVIETGGGRLSCEDRGGHFVAVNMGPPRMGWREIPLTEEADTSALPLDGAPVATSMGNPHCTFFVDDAEGADLTALGHKYEVHPLFAEGTNVQVASAIGPDRLRVRVWERGVGVTPASGSSSCAAAVAAVRRGLMGPRVTVVLDGGTLEVDWRDDGVWMTGETAIVARGEFLA